MRSPGAPLPRPTPTPEGGGGRNKARAPRRVPGAAEPERGRGRGGVGSGPRPPRARAEGGRGALAPQPGAQPAPGPDRRGADPGTWLEFSATKVHLVWVRPPLQEAKGSSAARGHRGAPVVPRPLPPRLGLRANLGAPRGVSAPG